MPEIDFGAWLRQAREAKGWSGERLAVELNTSQGLISMYEGGHRTPRRPRIIEIANLLGKNPAEALLSAGYAPGEDDNTGEIIRVIDPDEVRMVKYLRGVPPELRQSAINAVESYKTAGDLLRERQEANTIGKRADRHENPSVRENSNSKNSSNKGDSDDAIGTDK